MGANAEPQLTSIKIPFIFSPISHKHVIADLST